VDDIDTLRTCRLLRDGIDGSSVETSEIPSSLLRKPPLLAVHEVRSLILKLSVLVGNLSSVFLRLVPLDSNHTSITTNMPMEIATAMGQVLSCLVETAQSLSIDLEHVILNKMELNEKKYPVELCQVSLNPLLERLLSVLRILHLSHASL
jgi:hypothetical protein